MGNSEQLKGSQLVILFEKCSAGDCYDDATIKQLMRGKSILLFAN